MPTTSYVLIVTIVALSSVGLLAVALPADSPENNGDYIRFNSPHFKVTWLLEEFGTP